MIGRDTEIAMLMERWQQAKDGEGQVVVLCGESGIGKSRLTQVLRENIADEPHTRLRYHCSPHYTNSAFYPVIDRFERAAGFNRDDTPEVKLDKMEATLKQAVDDISEAAPLVASMLSLPVERYPPLNLGPQRQKDKTLEALTAQATGLAAKQPVLLTLEDAHWIDPTSLEVFSAVIEGIHDARVLFVITYCTDTNKRFTR